MPWGLVVKNGSRSGADHRTTCHALESEIVTFTLSAASTSVRTERRRSVSGFPSIASISIHQQVDQHLQHLRPVSENRGQIPGQLAPDDDMSLARIRADIEERVGNHVADIQALRIRCLGTQELANAADNLGGSQIVGADIRDDVLQFPQGRIPARPAGSWRRRHCSGWREAAGAPHARSPRSIPPSGQALRMRDDAGDLLRIPSAP